jgi:hypothetical protein
VLEQDVTSEDYQTSGEAHPAQRFRTIEKNGHSSSNVLIFTYGTTKIA